jgi:hypothetical protein
MLQSWDPVELGPPFCCRSKPLPNYFGNRFGEYLRDEAQSRVVPICHLESRNKDFSLIPAVTLSAGGAKSPFSSLFLPHRQNLVKPPFASNSPLST